MKNKKITRVLALSVLGLFALTGCDDIVAKPTDYEEPLVATTTFSDEIHNNIASVVYDSLHDAGIGGDVLNEILYLYAVDAFGPYNGNVWVNNTKVSETDEVTLEEAVNDDAKLATFIKSHKAYWDSNTEPATPSESEKARVITRYSTIQDRIAEEMFTKISGGSYTDRHEFYEARFLKSLRGSLESVADPDDKETKIYGPQQILPAVEPEEVFDEEKGYLHRENYDSEENTYVVDEIIPGIYRQLLAEQYLLDETYNTLGRSYARQVNIIKFTTNDNYPNAADHLAKELVAEINAKPADYKEGKIYKDCGDDLLERFKDYSKANIGVGVPGKDFDDEILDNAGLTSHTSTYTEIGKYWDGTNFGDLAEKYEKMKNVAEYGINSEIESTFTNNNAYPTYVGLAQEKLALAEGDNTTNGWFIKNGGLAELPDSIRSRLFNIGVATGVKETEEDLAKVERTYGKDGWEEGEDENAYICRINGHNYLKVASRAGKSATLENDILHYDSDSKTYYIVEVLQAVSSSKLSKTSERNYAHTLGEEEMQEIVAEVAKIVGKSESYTTLATKKCLRAMDIIYHDDSVYEYFKTNYPELFDSDAETSSSSSEETEAAE